jgi:hypothetical protein
MVAGAALGTKAQGSSAYQINAPMTAKQMKGSRPHGNVGKAQGLIKGSATLDKHSQIAWTLTYSGMTGDVTSALVRFKNAKNVLTAISLCLKPCKSGQTTFTFFDSQAQAEQFVKQVQQGKVDAVLDTKSNPGGEVRGVLTIKAAS